MTRDRTSALLPLVAATFALAACTGSGGGETDASTTDAAERTSAAMAPTVPAGTELTFVIDQTLSTADTEAGEMFDAHLAAPVTAADGSTVLAAGTAARGMVVESRESGGADDPATLIVRLETVEIDGRMVALDGSVVDAAVDASARDTGAETAGKIAIGAAAGAIIGQIIGKDTESTLAGAGAGAIAGTVVALTTRDGNATLPRGSTIVVRLDSPLTAG